MYYPLLEGNTCIFTNLPTIPTSIMPTINILKMWRYAVGKEWWFLITRKRIGSFWVRFPSRELQWFFLFIDLFLKALYKTTLKLNHWGEISMHLFINEIGYNPESDCCTSGITEEVVKVQSCTRSVQWKQHQQTAVQPEDRSEIYWLFVYLLIWCWVFFPPTGYDFPAIYS